MANDTRYAPVSKTCCRECDGTGGHPGRGDDGTGALPASSLIAPLNRAQTLAVLSEYASDAAELFLEDRAGSEGSYGFITSPHNLHTTYNIESSSNCYGWDSLYVDISNHKINDIVLKTISGKKFGKFESKKNEAGEDEYCQKGSIRSKKDRLFFYDLNMVTENDVYKWFEDFVKRQNERGSLLRRDDGKIFFAKPSGRFSTDNKYRSGKMVKKFKRMIGRIDDAILLTLTTYQPCIEKVMSANTNLSPVAYAICNIGVWISEFLKRLRSYQKRHGVPWEYVGYTLEMQENGFPHVHMIFRGSWIGKIKEIAALWPWCLENGVDYMDKKKLERKKKQKVKGLHLVNYVCGYVAKAAQKVVVNDKINRSWAFAAYFGIRAYNLSHKYKASPVEKLKDGAKAVWQWVGGYNLDTKTINVVNGLKRELIAIYKSAPWSKKGVAYETG